MGGRRAGGRQQSAARTCLSIWRGRAVRLASWVRATRTRPGWPFVCLRGPQSLGAALRRCRSATVDLCPRALPGVWPRGGIRGDRSASGHGARTVGLGANIAFPHGALALIRAAARLLDGDGAGHSPQRVSCRRAGNTSVPRKLRRWAGSSSARRQRPRSMLSAGSLQPGSELALRPRRKRSQRDD